MNQISSLTGARKQVEVKGISFEVVSDFIARKTFAINLQTKEVFVISAAGYIKNLKTIQTRIAAYIK